MFSVPQCMSTGTHAAGVWQCAIKVTTVFLQHVSCLPVVISLLEARSELGDYASKQHITHKLLLVSDGTLL